MNNIKNIGDRCLYEIKKQRWFPYKTGNLKFNATYGVAWSNSVYKITFDEKVAPYVVFLEEGTKPHDIPNAFGKGMTFGIGGRFDGKFHSGSTKHKGFISNKSVNAIVDFIAKTFNGKVVIK